MDRGQQWQAKALIQYEENSRRGSHVTARAKWAGRGYTNTSSQKSWNQCEDGRKHGMGPQVLVEGQWDNMVNRSYQTDLNVNTNEDFADHVGGLPKMWSESHCNVWSRQPIIQKCPPKRTKNPFRVVQTSLSTADVGWGCFHFNWHELRFCFNKNE